MKKYFEVINQILPLLETIEEALIYIQKQLKELRYEESLELIQDSIMGIASIEEAMQPMMPELNKNNIENTMALLKDHFHVVINAYEQKKEEHLVKQIEEGMIPAFMKWKEEIQRTLKPYVSF